MHIVIRAYFFGYFFIKILMFPRKFSPVNVIFRKFLSKFLYVILNILCKLPK